MGRTLWTKGILGIVVIMTLVAVSGCKRTVAIKSRWADKKITIDGKDGEWQGGMLFDEETNTKIGVRNDARNLYFCFILKDDTIQRQVLQEGFTLWVCQDKAKNKVWGLRYPVGGSQPGVESFGEGSGGPGREDGPPGTMDENRDEKGPSAGPPAGSLEGSGGPAMPQSQGGDGIVTMKEFELLESENEDGRLVTSNELAQYGISGCLSQNQGGGVIYEVKLPLASQVASSYAAVSSQNGGYLVGFLTEKSSMSGMGGGMGGGGMGGGGMGGGGMGGGGMGGGGMLQMDGGGMGGGMPGGSGGGIGSGPGMGGGTGNTTASSFELWTLIELAVAPGTAG